MSLKTMKGKKKTIHLGYTGSLSEERKINFKLFKWEILDLFP